MTADGGSGTATGSTFDAAEAEETAGLTAEAGEPEASDAGAAHEGDPRTDAAAATASGDGDEQPAPEAPAAEAATAEIPPEDTSEPAAEEGAPAAGEAAPLGTVAEGAAEPPAAEAASETSERAALLGTEAEGADRTGHVLPVEAQDPGIPSYAPELPSYASELPSYAPDPEEQARAVVDSAFAIEGEALTGPGSAVEGHLAAERELAGAAALLAAERYDEAAAEYDRLAAEHPALAAECLVQAGTALAALGNYREAAERYAVARDAGADQAAMDDRIWAACKGLEVEAASLYERLCPDGHHAAEAGQLAPGAVHEPNGPAKIFDAAAEALTRLGLRFSVITGEPRFLVPGLGNHAQYISHLCVDEERCFVLFYTMCPLMAPEHKRPAIAELLTRANYGMSLGNFELDLRDGEIRYKTSIDVEGSRLTQPLLAPLIYASRSTMDRYMPAIIDVLYQGGDPAVALESVERGQD